LPDLDARATTTTLAWLDTVAPGAIAMLSSSVNEKEACPPWCARPPGAFRSFNGPGEDKHGVAR
jgi:hypothetical protein